MRSTINFLNFFGKWKLGLTIRYVIARTHYFSSKSVIAQINHFWAIWQYWKMYKWVFFIIGYHKHDKGNQTEPSKLKYFTHGNHG